MEWLFDYESFMPRYSCGPGWTDWLVALQVVANIAIFASYMTIGCWLWRVRSMLPVGSAVWTLFASFVFLCGVTHAFDAAMFYRAMYRADTLMRTATMSVSLATAILLPTVTSALRSERTRRKIDEKQQRERWRDRISHAIRRAQEHPGDVADILRSLEQDLASTR